jgi:hypothetical protein
MIARALLLVALLTMSPSALAQYRLRGDALASAQAPAGLVVLSGEASPRTWIATEAVIWAGLRESATDELDADGDALVAVVRLRDPGGRGEAKLGRFVLTAGALRPLHMDGVHARGREEETGFGLEAWGGIPAAREGGWGETDWLAGARASWARGSLVLVGLGYLQQRDHSRRSDEEVGADLTVAPTGWLDVTARASWDVINPGISDAYASVVGRIEPVRVELWSSSRSPARLLPATSIFSAIGDVASEQIGVTATWLAAPRLDLRATVAARWAGEELGSDASARALLRLDSRGEGAFSIEGRRTTTVAPWTGVRFALRVPLHDGLHAATELELAAPEQDQGRGQLWPWGLVAVGWRFAEVWDASAAVEASASPEHERLLTAIVRLATRWEGP